MYYGCLAVLVEFRILVAGSWFKAYGLVYYNRLKSSGRAARAMRHDGGVVSEGVLDRDCATTHIWL